MARGRGATYDHPPETEAWHPLQHFADLFFQDVGLALTAAHVHSLPTPLTWAAKSVYDAVCQEGDGSMATKDFS